MKRIVYMGTPEYAKVILEAILKDNKFEVTLVLTQPDRPVGRHQELMSPPVKSLALEYNLPILQPQSLKENGIYDAIVDAKPDIIVVAAFGQLLPKNILDIAPCINLHASLLPLYRGASPVQQCLLNGDKYTGITAMLMEEGLDSGPVLAYRYFKIPNDMVVTGLMERLSYDAALLTIEVLKNFDNLIPLPQTGAAATHCRKIQKSDGEVDFSNASEIINKYRAFYGWPGVFLANGLKLSGLEIVDINSKNKAGEILSIENDSIIAGCNKGSIRISSLQAPSKKAMNAKSYLVGRGLKIGDTLI
ncbi:MAG: methionyl-tRNA formyltransferase [Campylobacterales bacterium]|nr:methionyl-tRNA formyltransferase [Campylobacterales bacterium]